jgi:hypothetical protein
VAILEGGRGKTRPIEFARIAVRLEETRRREIPFDLCKIGQTLKNAREEKGLTLDEVSNALFIKRRVTEAIESADWDSLPCPLYVKGHVRQYAALLKIADMLKAEMPSSGEQPSTAAQGVAAATNEGAPKGWGQKKKVVAASAAGALVVVFLVFQNLPKKTYVVPVAESAGSSHQRVRTSVKTQSLEASTKSRPVEESRVAAEQSEEVVGTSKKLAILCRERTWVRIVIDGAEQKDLTLNPEEAVRLNAKRNFDLLIGNAGGVKLFYNGKDTGFTGGHGEVRRISLS